jgi:hypothetical protein
MKTKFFQILGVVAVSVISFNSCTTDACKDVDCGLNGECVDGDCVCDAGYEGVNCETEERAKFIAAYSVSESCTSGNYTYNITAATSATNISSIVVSNFGDYGVSVTGTVDGSTLTFASQSVTISGSAASISGSGQLSGSILTITYTIVAGTESDTCTMTCTKQ